MSRILAAMVSLLALIGCTSPPPPASPAMNLEEAAARLSKRSGRSIRPYSTQDFGREQNPAGRSVVVADADAVRILDAIRGELGPGLIAFIGCTNSLADPKDVGSEIVVAPGQSQFDILRVAQSDAVNFDMLTEDLVRKLEEYDRLYGIDIFQAETDTIQFRLRSLPADMKAFADDLYKFCPDIVDQGVGTVDALAEEIRTRRRVFLWWD